MLTSTPIVLFLIQEEEGCSCFPGWYGIDCSSNKPLSAQDSESLVKKYKAKVASATKGGVAPPEDNSGASLPPITKMYVPKKLPEVSLDLTSPGGPDPEEVERQEALKKKKAKKGKGKGKGGKNGSGSSDDDDEEGGRKKKRGLGDDDDDEDEKSGNKKRSMYDPDEPDPAQKGTMPNPQLKASGGVIPLEGEEPEEPITYDDTAETIANTWWKPRKGQPALDLEVAVEDAEDLADYIDAWNPSDPNSLPLPDSLFLTPEMRAALAEDMRKMMDELAAAKRALDKLREQIENERKKLAGQNGPVDTKQASELQKELAKKLEELRLQKERDNAQVRKKLHKMVEEHIIKKRAEQANEEHKANPKCPAACGLGVSHGHCKGAVCACDDGYTGKICTKSKCSSACKNGGVCVATDSSKTKFACKCVTGFTGPACGDVLCKDKCSGHGTCINKKCQCKEGWKGTRCQTTDPVCGELCVPNGPAKGTCDFKAKKCKCDAGWTGPTCFDETGCDPSCSKNGFCRSGKCVCDFGYKGETCSEYACKHSCGEHGTCDSSKGLCVCDPGYSGEDCSQYQRNMCLIACEVHCRTLGHGVGRYKPVKPMSRNPLLEPPALDGKSKEACLNECTRQFCKVDLSSKIGRDNMMLQRL